MASQYDLIYDQLVLRNKLTIKAENLNKESIRVGWYRYRKRNSLLLGKRTNWKIEIRKKKDNKLEIEILPSEAKQLVIEVL